MGVGKQAGKRVVSGRTLTPEEMVGETEVRSQTGSKRFREDIKN